MGVYLSLYPHYSKDNVHHIEDITDRPAFITPFPHHGCIMSLLILIIGDAIIWKFTVCYWHIVTHINSQSHLNIKRWCLFVTKKKKPTSSKSNQYSLQAPPLIQINIIKIGTLYTILVYFLLFFCNSEEEEEKPIQIWVSYKKHVSWGENQSNQSLNRLRRDLIC